LRPLLYRRVLTDHRAEFLVTGRHEHHPLVPAHTSRQGTPRVDGPDLALIGFPEARHSFASAAISAGVNAKAL
jgi:hypothetical protein